jgi:hypothetical protein
MDVRVEQWAKAPEPMLVTLAGIEALVIPVLFEKAFAAMATTDWPLIVLGIITEPEGPPAAAQPVRVTWLLLVVVTKTAGLVPKSVAA